MTLRPLFIAAACAALAACQPTMVTTAPTTSTLSFGNDSSTWAFDGECDDPRFQGVGMAAMGSLTNANIMRDATDCRNMFNAGQITFLNPNGIVNTVSAPVRPSVNFGNDSSSWAFDGECDDPRFQGRGMAAAGSLTTSNQFRDATDCRNLFNSGAVVIRTGGFSPTPSAPSISFGNDSSTWAFDGECDDPRFSGPGMAASGSLTSANIQRDATDCRNLFNAGRVF